MSDELYKPVKINQTVADATGNQAVVKDTNDLQAIATVDVANNAVNLSDKEEPKETNLPSQIATSFDNDQIYDFVKVAGKSGSKESEDKSFKVLKDKSTHYNPARNNNFIVAIDFWRSSSNYVNVVPSEYIKSIKSPLVRIKENETVSMGLYEVDLTTIVKSGETISIEVNESDNRTVITKVLNALSIYQSPDNQNSGVYGDFRKNFWKIHHTVLDYTGNVKLIAKYICTPSFNIDFMNEYENIKSESYTLDFKVVNYNIYDNSGKKLI